MAVRTASAEWKGDLKGGRGTVKSESGAVDGQYSFSSRFEEGIGTNPEELVGAAHAGCFSMAFANILAGAGHTPKSVRTTARVHLTVGEGGPSISRIELSCMAEVPGIDDDAFQEHAQAAKVGCPVSKALKAVDVHLEATLVS